MNEVNNKCHLFKSCTFSFDSGYYSSDSMSSDNDCFSENDNITGDAIEVVECVVDSFVNTLKPSKKSNKKFNCKNLLKKNSLSKKNIELKKQLKKLKKEIDSYESNNSEKILTFSDIKVKNNISNQVVLNDTSMKIKSDELVKNKHWSNEFKIGDILFRHSLFRLTLVGVYIGENDVLYIRKISKFPWVSSLCGYIKVQPSLIKLDTFNNKNNYLIVERSNKNITRECILQEIKNDTFNYHFLFSNS